MNRRHREALVAAASAGLLLLGRGQSMATLTNATNQDPEPLSRMVAFELFVAPAAASGSG